LTATGTDRNTPQRVGTDSNWKSVSATNAHSLAIKTDGSLYAWGYGGSGRLGLGNSGTGTERNTPTIVGTDYNWAAVAAGSFSW